MPQVGKPLEVVFRLPPFPTLKNALPGQLDTGVGCS